MTRWDDVGRGSDSVTLAARIEAAVTGAGVVRTLTVFRAGQPTVLKTTYQAPRTALEAVTRALAACGYNAELVVEPDAETVTWTTSEPLDSRS